MDELCTTCGTRGVSTSSSCMSGKQAGERGQQRWEGRFQAGRDVKGVHTVRRWHYDVVDRFWPRTTQPRPWGCMDSHIRLTPDVHTCGIAWIRDDAHLGPGLAPALIPEQPPPQPSQVGVQRLRVAAAVLHRSRSAAHLDRHHVVEVERGEQQDGVVSIGEREDGVEDGLVSAGRHHHIVLQRGRGGGGGMLMLRIKCEDVVEDVLVSAGCYHDIVLSGGGGQREGRAG